MQPPLPEKIQTAVVTGGARGIGALAVRALHRAGFRTIITDADPGDEAAALASELDLAGDTAVTATLDVTRAEDFESILQKCIDRWGSVEVLVNTATRGGATRLLDMDPSDFKETLTVHAGGTFLASQIFGRHFKARGYGRIINLATAHVHNGSGANTTHDATSEGAMLTLTRMFAHDLADFGVTCNAIALGPMAVPMLPPAPYAAQLDSEPGVFSTGLLGDPFFVGELVALLAGVHAGLVNGACWEVPLGLGNGEFHTR